MFLTPTHTTLSLSCVWIYSQRTKRKKDITEHKDRTLSPSPPFQVLILINQLHITVTVCFLIDVNSQDLVFYSLFFI